MSSESRHPTLYSEYLSSAWLTKLCTTLVDSILCLYYRVGRNVAAGMTGGLAYILDEDDTLIPKVCVVQKLKSYLSPPPHYNPAPTPYTLHRERERSSHSYCWLSPLVTFQFPKHERVGNHATTCFDCTCVSGCDLYF